MREVCDECDEEYSKEIQSATCPHTKRARKVEPLKFEAKWCMRVEDVYLHGVTTDRQLTGEFRPTREGEEYVGDNGKGILKHGVGSRMPRLIVEPSPREIVDSRTGLLIRVSDVYGEEPVEVPGGWRLKKVLVPDFFRIPLANEWIINPVSRSPLIHTTNRWKGPAIIIERV